MCLDTTRDIQPTPLIESGWKQFRGTDTAPAFEAQSLHGNANVPLNSWLIAETGQKIKANSGAKYTSGFHVYTGEKKSGRWRRVYFRRSHAEGDQGGHNIVIARELFVPSDPEGWPPLENAA